MARPRPLDKTRQFLAIVRKNFILQTRGRRSLLGIAGVAGLILQLLLPVSFFYVMYLPKYYIKPTHYDETLGWPAVRLESASWGEDYDGPATSRHPLGRAALILTPDTPEVRGLGRVLARTLACPRDPALRVCRTARKPSNFHCLFMPLEGAYGDPRDQVGNSTDSSSGVGVGGAPAKAGTAAGSRPLDREEGRAEGEVLELEDGELWAVVGGSSSAAVAGITETGRWSDWQAGGIAGADGGSGDVEAAEAEAVTIAAAAEDILLADDPCADFSVCVTTPACYEHVLQNQITFMANEEAARHATVTLNGHWDAVVHFPRAVAAPAPAPAAAAADAAAASPGDSFQAAAGDGTSSLGVAASGSSSAAVPPPSSVSELMSSVVVDMNHTDVPPTRFLLDLFEVAPHPRNGLMLYRRYWFFANLQLAIHRAVIGVHVAENSAPRPPAPPAPSPPNPAAPPEAAPAPTGAPTAQPVHRPQEGRRLLDEDEGGRGRAIGDPYEFAVPANVEVSYKSFPWPAVTEDLGAAAAAVFFQLLLVYAFLPPTRAVVGDIVREKELRLREGMRVLGLSEPSYWLSWGLTHWVLLAISGALCTAAGTYPFANSSPGIMLVFFWLYGAALVSYGYCLSTLFSSSRVAGTVVQLLYALSMVPGFVLPAVYEYGSWTWYAACLSPPSAATLYAAALVNWEKVAKGIRMSTLWTPITQANGFCAGTVLWMLALDVVLFAVLTWYLDKVLPKSYGQRLPWWFVFDPRYWSQRGGGRRGGSGRGPGGGVASSWRRVWRRLLMGRGAAAGPSTTGLLLGPETDADAEYGTSPAAVEIRGLVKIFRTLTGDSKVAVDHLDLQIDSGRITALLGHNGAGKTTTIHILTGMLQPTAGSATVNGFDVATQMDSIRASLGICPQFDILWPDLTVYEHLELYGAIKGYQRNELPQVATSAAAKVGLTPKLHSPAGDLSGGQRRKLSVAIAFMGDPAVVFLDEPTSGMDPYSRRFTWEVIRQHRSEAAIVLTTHSMEEADLLGDRVVILARGRVAAEGTGMELKAEYGVGYNLTMVMQQQQQQVEGNVGRTAEEKDISGAAGDQGEDGGGDGGGSGGRSPAAVTSSGAAAPPADAATVLAFVRQHVPSADLLSAAGAELVVRLPREVAPAFPGLLRALDGPMGRQQLGVASYGLSLTTLEEVFLSITAAAEQQAEAEEADSRAGAASPTLATHGGSIASNGSVLRPPASAVTATSAPRSPAEVPLAPTAAAVTAPPPPPPSPPPPAHPAPLSGWRLYGQQLRALLAKRALCARRDRLAVLIQLAVPLALVYLALWISSLQVRELSQPPLELSRRTALFDRPLAWSASPEVRNASDGCSVPGGPGGGGGGSSCLAALLAGHPGGGKAIDSGATALYFGDRSTRLEDYLLSRWSTGGGPLYDALHVTGLPSPPALVDAASTWPPSTATKTTALKPDATAAAQPPPPPALSFVLLTNQSAISALPAALADAMTAAWSYINLGLAPPSPPPPPTTTTMTMTETETETVTETTGAGGSAQPPPPGAAPLVSFSAVSWPLPTLPVEPLVQIQRSAASLMLVLCLVLAGSVLTASFVVFIVREQDNNSKHLQLVSGAPSTAYWAANYIWDLVSYSLSAAGLLALVASYRLPQYSGRRLAAVAGLLAGFGPAGISLTYLLHFPFRDEMRALQRLNTAYFLTGYLGFIATWIADLIQLLVQPKALAEWNVAAKAVLGTFSPHYCFARGMYDVQLTYVTDIPFIQRLKPFDWNVYGKPVVYMAVQALVYGSLAVLYDAGVFTLAYAHGQDAVRSVLGWLGRRRADGRDGASERRGRRERRASDGCEGGSDATRLLAMEQGVPLAPAAAVDGPVHVPASGEYGGPGDEPRGNGAGGGYEHGEDQDEDEDVDVAAEKEAVIEGRRSQCQVLLVGVRKSYSQGLWRPAVAAVRGLWVGVPAGECFGLLGVNGAGKTTTFRMLTGEVLPDEGDARVGGFSVRTQLEAARRQLGYCPQFEALPGAMTGREVAAMYARLRGVPEPFVGQLVSHLLQRLGLEAAANSPCGGYSGGMKRKLGVAVALIGDPRVCALDEPSTGMDPGARRGLWTCLQNEVIRAGRTVILTSHSMEECEALCTRLTILVAGRLRCLGTVQHLKSRFGGGYILEIKTLPRSASTASLAGAVAGAVQPAAGAAQPASRPLELSVAVAAAPRSGGDGAAAAAATTAAPHAPTRLRAAGSGAAAGALDSAAAGAELTEWVASICPGATLSFVDQNRYTFHIPRGAGAAAGGGPEVDLAALFAAVESQRGALGIVDYCLTQTTLEQLFVAMAGAAAAAGGADEA